MTQAQGDGPASPKLNGDAEAANVGAADTAKAGDARHPRRAISRWPVVVTVLGLGLAAILVYLGGRLAGSPAPPPDLSHPGTPEHPRGVTVLMRDYVFNPTPLYLVAGETVVFHIIDAGMLQHEFVIGDDAVQQAWAAADAAATPGGPLATAPVASVAADVGGLRVLLQPGDQRDVVYTVPANDQLQLVCHLPGHAGRGMAGSVILATP